MSSTMGTSVPTILSEGINARAHKRDKYNSISRSDFVGINPLIHELEKRSVSVTRVGVVPSARARRFEQVFLCVPCVFPEIFSSKRTDCLIFAWCNRAFAGDSFDK